MFSGLPDIDARLVKRQLQMAVGWRRRLHRFCLRTDHLTPAEPAPLLEEPATLEPATLEETATLEEIGKQFGGTHERVRQLQNATWAKLRHKIDELEKAPQ